jgi:hypothetical protein
LLRGKLRSALCRLSVRELEEEEEGERDILPKPKFPEVWRLKNISIEMGVSPCDWRRRFV